MFKCAFYNHFYRPYTLETAGLNGRSLTTRLATPPLWLLRLKLYVGATRDFLHPTTASTPPYTPTATSLYTPTSRPHPPDSQAPSAGCLVCIPRTLIQILVRYLMIRGYTPKTRLFGCVPGVHATRVPGACGRGGGGSHFGGVVLRRR